jgi:spermidine synthase
MRPISFFIFFIYFLSGVAGLAYEVLWARQLGLVFGVSNFGIAVTIAAFMAGLGGGALVASRFAFSLSRPLLVFALIEAFLAVFAFNIPSLLAFTDATVTEMSAGADLNSWLALQGVALFLLMALPAFVMGLGFPLVLSLCRQHNISLASIYAVNTFGGVVGCMYPLMLLPLVGWTVSVRLMAIVSLLIAVLCLVAHFLNRKKTEEVASETAIVSWKTLALYALIGAMALVIQVAWSRLYGMFLLRTEYVVALLIASFLVGIGLGSFLGRWLRSQIWLAVLPIMVAVGVLITLFSLPWVAAWAESSSFSSLSDAVWTQAALLMLLTLPATLAFGAWLPVLAHAQEDAHSGGAKLYAANAMGSAVGALIAGFVLMPLLGTTATLVLAMVVVLLVAAAWVPMRWYRFATVPFLIAGIFVLPLPDVAKLLPVSNGDTKDLALFENALAVTHVVENKEGHRFLLSDLQRMDASTEPTALTVQRIQGALPLMLANNPREVLLLGLGTGITAAGVLPYDGVNITAVELSEGAIRAAGKEFFHANDGVVSRATIINDDARRFIKASDRQFDVIIGDLFHPDLVGRSALLSQQQFERVKLRLSDDGIFVQWIALNQFDPYSLKVVLQTFRQAFPNNAIFADGFRLALVGGHQPVTAEGMLKKLEYDESGELFMGEDAWTWLARYWGAIPDFAVPLQDEWAPVIEFSLPAARYAKAVDLREALRFLLQLRPESQQAASALGLVEPANIDKFAKAFESSNLIYTSWYAGMKGDAEQAAQFLNLAYQTNPIDRWVSFALADRLYAGLDEMARTQGMSKRDGLARILQIRPDHVEAMKQLWRLEMASGKFESAAELKRQLLRFNPYDPELQ